MNGFFVVLSDFDYVLFDMGVGFLKEQLLFILLVEDIFVVIMFELMVIMDVYSVIKYFFFVDEWLIVNIVVNCVCV